MEGLVPILPLLAVVALFYLLIIGPQRRRSRDMMAMQSALAVGDRVMLTSGIHGTVAALGEETVEVEVAPATVLTVARGAIGRVVDPLAADEPPQQRYDDTPESDTDDERGV